MPESITQYYNMKSLVVQQSWLTKISNAPELHRLLTFECLQNFSVVGVVHLVKDTLHISFTAYMRTARSSLQYCQTFLWLVSSAWVSPRGYDPIDAAFAFLSHCSQPQRRFGRRLVGFQQKSASRMMDQVQRGHRGARTISK